MEYVLCEYNFYESVTCNCIKCQIFATFKNFWSLSIAFQPSFLKTKYVANTMLGSGYEAKMLIHTTYKNDLVCQKNTRVSARPTALGAAYLQQQKREDLSTKDKVGVLRYKHYEIITFEFIVRYTM